MKGDNSKYVVKGRIKEFNYLQDIYFYNDIRFREYALCNNRIRVKGINRSGVFKSKMTNIRFLEDLKIQKIEISTELAFMTRQDILCFEKETQTYSYVNDVLKYIKDNSLPKIKMNSIDDETFIKAQSFVSRLQGLILNKSYDDIISDFINYPLVNKYVLNGRKRQDNLTIHTLAENFNNVFSVETLRKIVETDLNTIYPSENFMVIGSLRIQISKDNEFKINTVITLKKYDA